MLFFDNKKKKAGEGERRVAPISNSLPVGRVGQRDVWALCRPKGGLQALSPPALQCGAQAPWEGEGFLEFFYLYGVRLCPTTQMGCVR